MVIQVYCKFIVIEIACSYLALCMVLGDYYSCYIITLRFTQQRRKPCLVNFLGNTNLNTLGKKGTIKNLCLQTLQNV